jgi:probable sporulation protein (polysaccharide deacetylase family)
MNRNKLMLVVFVFLFVFVLGKYSGVQDFIVAGQESGAYTFDGLKNNGEKDALLKEIEQEATKRYIAPIDAKIDRIWKAIPGYNGIEVDIEKTYLQAKKQEAGASIPFVYREVPPAVKLEDLEPNPIYRGNPAKPMVALMINVAWGNEYIIPMLDTLDKAKVKATFFFDGSWLNKNTELALEIKKREHQIENHAYSHPNMSKLARSRATLEISKTKDLLAKRLGVENKWFAPPSGDFNDQTVKLAAEQGLKTVLWTLDTVDWRKPNPSDVVAKISKHVEAGSLILMHPTASSSQALAGMIAAIESKGLHIGTVAQVLSPNRIEATTFE